MEAANHSTIQKAYQPVEVAKWTPASPYDKTTFGNGLPTDLYIKIFKLLSLLQLNTAMRVCKHWYKMGEKNAVWNEFSLIPAENLSQITFSIRQRFIQACAFFKFVKTSKSSRGAAAPLPELKDGESFPKYGSQLSYNFRTRTWRLHAMAQPQNPFLAEIQAKEVIGHLCYYVSDHRLGCYNLEKKVVEWTHLLPGENSKVLYIKLIKNTPWFVIVREKGNVMGAVEIYDSESKKQAVFPDPFYLPQFDNYLEKNSPFERFCSWNQHQLIIRSMYQMQSQSLSHPVVSRTLRPCVTHYHLPLSLACQ